ncbi:FAD binding domain protein [Neofusicoccum parvum]|nr:FAD binding domain protein [Neofusicoccum parvum]
MASNLHQFARYPESGVSVLVVGGGIGGLSCAIEAYRKGHNVRLVEKQVNINDGGAIIAVPNPALGVFSNWPGFLERCRKHAMNPICRMMRADHTHIKDTPLAHPELPAMPINRPALHQTLFDFAIEVGVPIEQGRTVSAYFEDEHQAGVVYDDGSREMADVVVAADGVGSKARGLVVGEPQEPIPSGFACHLVTFPAGPALENQAIRDGFGDFQNGVMFALGPGVHMAVGRTEEMLTWLMVHKDEGSDGDAFKKAVSASSALKHVETWASFYKEVINASPQGEILLWRLKWRDPQGTYISPRARVVQIGDSAHSFLPTSGAGAGMAVEDAGCLASCLQLSGKSNVPLALKVHNLLRYERVTCAQKMGFKNREVFHQADWNVKIAPQTGGTFSGKWLTSHKVEEYVYENYGRAVQHLLIGAPFRNTNSVPGFKFRPWSVRELLEASSRGEPDTDEGEWYN